MPRQPVSDADLARLGRFQGTIERNANFRQQASNHNLGRNVRVVKLLAYVGLLRQAGKPLAGPIKCVAAVRQNFSSSQSGTHMGLPTGPMQAAHFLPGQVTINGRPVWDYSNDPGTRGRIEFLFAEVEHLPAVFNQADTAAENKGQQGGLCSALTVACHTMVNATGIATANPIATLRVPLGILEKAYEEWHKNAIAGLQNALTSKQSSESLPPLVGNPYEGYTAESIEARSTATPSVWNREFSADVLAYYLEDQRQRNWPWVMSGCQSAVREVESGFKP
jgi:hypothetical protein